MNFLKNFKGFLDPKTNNKIPPKPLEVLNLSSNLKSLLNSNVREDLGILNKSSFTIRTQQDIDGGGEEANASTSVEISLGKIKVLEKKLLEKNKENQVLGMNVQRLEKDLLSVNIFIFFLSKYIKYGIFY